MTRSRTSSLSLSRGCWSNPELAHTFARRVTDDPIRHPVADRAPPPGVGFVDLVGFVEGGPVLVLEHEVWAKLPATGDPPPGR